MAEMDIPDSLKSDHLFLLIGGNPLPNWVSAQLLLRDGGQLYLVHSKETKSVAHRLAKVFLQNGFEQSSYVSVGDASDATAIYDAVLEKLDKINSGQIGFNYTGGTKVMAVHGFAALKENAPAGMGPLVFSYLDAQTLEMRFDEGDEPIPVELNERVRLTFDALLDVQYADEWRWRIDPVRSPIAWDVALELAKLHRSVPSYKAWRKLLRSLRNTSNDSLLRQTLQWPVPLIPLARKLARKPDVNITLQELCGEQEFPFGKPTQLISWLEGKWLESLVLGYLREKKQDYALSDYLANVELLARGNTIEADVAAVRGYQLHTFSCYAGSDKMRTKWHIMEAYMRAKQLGGEEAGAVLVSLTENPEQVENEVDETWQARGRIKVFGRAHLEDLGNHLRDWFRSPIKLREKRS